MKKKNPILERKYKEGYENGYKNGMDFAKVQFATYLEKKLNTLSEVNGIGDKTSEKMLSHFGKDYIKLKK